MEYIEKPKTASLLRFDALISLAMLIVTLLLSKKTVSEALSGTEGLGLGPYKYFMLAMVFISFSIFLIYGLSINRNNLFLWFAVFYSFWALFATFASGMYPLVEMPYRFIRMSYWAWILIISYYSVLHLNTFKFHVAIVYVFLPILFYFFFIMQRANLGFWGTVAFNPIFFISFLMPAILLIRSKIFKISGLLLIFVAVLLAYKRSAAVAFITSIPVYFYAHITISTSSKFKKLIPVIVGGTFLLLLFALSFSVLSSMVGLDWGGRLAGATAGGSGRDAIYMGYLRMLGSQSASEWMMGHGHLASQYTNIGWAHNDILEVIYSFGLPGLMFYLLFIGQLAKTFFDMKRCKYRHFDAFAVSLVIFFWGTMFSMLIIQAYWFLNLAFFWGWVIADFHNAKRYGDPDKIGNPLYAYAYEDEYEYEYEDRDGNENEEYYDYSYQV